MFPWFEESLDQGDNPCIVDTALLPNDIDLGSDHAAEFLLSLIGALDDSKEDFGGRFLVGEPSNLLGHGCPSRRIGVTILELDFIIARSGYIVDNPAMTQSLTLEKSGLSTKEWNVLKKLDTPTKIQDFVNKLKFNHEKGGETIQSPRRALRSNKIHCLEGALLAATALWIQGREPLLLDLKAVEPDFDHVVALFKEGKHWGAISKTNHAVLRYREPIYRDVRELAMSYFHEYFLQDGLKTMRSFSRPLNLSTVDISWITSENDLFKISERLDRLSHTRILSAKQVKGLRKADPLERRAGNIAE